jgi:hypothetical protein
MAIARKLRDLATDAVVLPTKRDLYQRKCADLDAAKAELARTVARVLEQEKIQQTSQRRGYAELLALKAAQEAKVERLSHEGGLLKQALIDSRPQPPLSPQQQHWADAFDAAANFDPYEKCGRGTPEQIAKAQADLDKLNLEYRLNQPSGNAREAWSLKKDAAETRLAALQGPPYPPHRPFATNEELKAARLKEGLK